MKNLVTIRFGSHLYGTSTPTSDLDFKSVHLPPAADILLQRVQDSISRKREKSGGEKNVPGESDEESYSLQRYLALLVQGQTVAIDMLFAPSGNTIASSPTWETIRANRSRLLTKKSIAFVGYCRTQANKYGIKGSRVAAAKQVTEFLQQQVARLGTTPKLWEVAELLPPLFDDHTRVMQQVVNRDGDIGTYLECCNRKVDYNATIYQALQVFERIYKNYGARARMAQSSEGVDWKALSHAVRVGQEALELLRTGVITFPLVEAERILDIKMGKCAYPEVAEQIEQLLVEVEESSVSSALPEEADREWVDWFVKEAYRGVVLTTSE